jgi:hypothetical protein
MIHRPGSRIPFGVPELHGYSVDSDGQVWRIGGTRTGRDRPLNGIGFTDAIRAWEPRASLGGMRVLCTMSGVWQYCRESTPGASTNRLQRHRDAMGFRMYYLNALGPEFVYAVEGQFRDECSAWFVIRTDASKRAPLLVAGLIAFVALSRNPPDPPLRSE